MDLIRPFNLTIDEIHILEAFVRDKAISCCSYSDVSCYNNCPFGGISRSVKCARDDEMFAGLKLYEVSKIILDENNDIYWRE